MKGKRRNLNVATNSSVQATSLVSEHSLNQQVTYAVTPSKPYNLTSHAIQIVETYSTVQLLRYETGFKLNALVITGK